MPEKGANKSLSMGTFDTQTLFIQIRPPQSKKNNNKLTPPKKPSRLEQMAKIDPASYLGGLYLYILLVHAASCVCQIMPVLQEFI